MKRPAAAKRQAFRFAMPLRRLRGAGKSPHLLQHFPPNATYFAKTPLSYLGAGAFHFDSRSRTTSGATSRSMMPFLDVDVDDVAFFDGGDRAAADSFRRNVADHEAARGAAEPAIGEQCDGVRQAPRP